MLVSNDVTSTNAWNFYWKYDLDECALINESSLFSATFEQGGKFSCY